MEDKRGTMTNRHGKRRMYPIISSLNIGGEGGIAGLFVFGGALAIAGFMAVSSFARNKHKPNKPKPKSQQLFLDEQGCKSQEHHDTIYHSTMQPDQDTTCCWASNMIMNQVSNSSELSAESMILMEKSEVESRSVEESPTGFHHQEIVFSDSSHPESAASSTEECLVSSFNSPSGQAREEGKDEEPEDDLTSSETETETDDDDMMSDDVTEIGEEEDGSKVTRTTILDLDYKEEPVWPPELVQHAKRKLKGDTRVCADSDTDDSDYETITVPKHATMNQNLNLLMVPNNQPLTWVFSLMLLALLLLLVLLTRRPQESFYVLEEGNSVVKRI